MIRFLYILLILFVPSISEAQIVSRNKGKAQNTGVAKTAVSDSQKANALTNTVGARYVDPFIGSEGLGRVFIGPSCPYGMVKPGPDCGVSNNAGWAPMPAEMTGFSQVHVSGTGGGPKYGNILVKFEGKRTSEEARLGYYSCTLEDGRKAEVTTAERASFYRFSMEQKGFNTKELKNSDISFDLGHFLGKSPVPKAREAQQLEDQHIIHLTDSTWQGWQSVSGGWNNGAAYTVYFCAVSKKVKSNPDESGSSLLLKIGISFVSIDQAKRNLQEDIPHWNFDRTYNECLRKWDAILNKVQVADDASADQKHMFYTALYHTMLMPVDRTKDQTHPAPPVKGGRNVSELSSGSSSNFTPSLNGRAGVGLYDDYYAIWDTYRTNTPLITLLDPERETDIVNGLLNIYKETGYMPDARSGNSNGRTQGGSNAEIVVADALAKGLDIDYDLALEAMLKDAEQAPDNDEAEGRGGLFQYNSLGYIPFGIARAGNRTVEYSFDDWAIAQVAKALRDRSDMKYDQKHYFDIYNKYIAQSERWKNLWRKDYEQDGVKGFIMPKDADGNWLDDVPFGQDRFMNHTFKYTPELSYEGPWYCAWWSCFMYEASSWEYSLSIPHEVPGLIEACGGKDAFDKRLDTFFEHGYYNVANEPSFLTPMLYHFIGKPEKSTARVKQIVDKYFNASRSGLPGNDDSGAMSAWLAFHEMGLYPNAGHDYYLIHTPLLSSVTITLDNGKTLIIKKEAGNTDECTFNGKVLTNWRITHQELMQGGTLLVKTHTQSVLADIPSAKTSRKDAEYKYVFTYSLHGQTRKFDVNIAPRNGGYVFSYGIQRNQQYWKGTYTMTEMARNMAKSISYLQPTDGLNVTLPDDELFAIISNEVFNQIKKKKSCTWCNETFRLVPQTEDEEDAHLLHLKSSDSAFEIWIKDDPNLPLIMKAENNPSEINWEVKVTR